MFRLDSFRVYDQKPLLGVIQPAFSPDWKPVNIMIGGLVAVKLGVKDRHGVEVCEGDILRGSFEPVTNQKGRFVVRYQPNEARFVVRFEWGKDFVEPAHSLRVCDFNEWIARNCSVISNVILMQIRREKAQKLVCGIKFFSSGFQITERDTVNFLNYIHEHKALLNDNNIARWYKAIQNF